ncbi:MAG: hypothetical protein WC394_05250, partial [Candidatus Omnitrophota bacterium]
EGLRPQGNFSNIFLGDENSVGGVTATDVARLLGFNVDLTTCNLTLDNGASSKYYGIILRKDFELGSGSGTNIAQGGLENRSGYKEAEPGEYQKWQEYRIVLFDSIDWRNDNWYIGYAGFVDISLDNKGVIHAHQVNLERKIGDDGWFARMKAGYTGTYAEDSVFIDENIPLPINGQVYNISVPVQRDLVVDEGYVFGQLGFGKRAPNGRYEIEFFVRGIKDDSNWSDVAAIMPGVRIEGRVTRGIRAGVEAMSNGEVTKAKAAVDIKFGRDVKLNIAANYDQGHYNRAGVEGNLTVPLGERFGAIFTAGQLLTGREGADMPYFGVTLGPVAKFGGKHMTPQEKAQAAHGISVSNIDNLVEQGKFPEGVSPEFTGLLNEYFYGESVPGKITVPDADKVQLSHVWIDGQQYLLAYNPKAIQRDLAMLRDTEAFGIKEYFDGTRGLLSESEWRRSFPLEFMSDTQLERAGISVVDQELSYTLNGQVITTRAFLLNRPVQIIDQNGDVVTVDNVPLNYYDDAQGVKQAIPEAERRMFLVERDGNIAAVRLSLRAMEEADKRYEGFGFIADNNEGAVSLSEKEWEEAILGGHLFGKAVRGNGGEILRDALGEPVQAFSIRGFQTTIDGRKVILNGSWELGKKGYERLNSLSRDYFTVTAPNGALRFLNEKDMVENYDDLGLVGIQDKDGIYKLTVSDPDGAYNPELGDLLEGGKSYRPIYVPDVILERDLAFYQGRIWLKNGDLIILDSDEETLDGAERVIGFASRQAGRYLREPITDSVLDRLISDEGYTSDKHRLSGEQTTSSTGMYLWSKDLNDNGKIDNNEIAWKAYPAVELLIPEEYKAQAEEDLLSGWLPVYSIGMHSDFIEMEFNNLGLQSLSRVYKNNLIVVDKYGRSRYIPVTDISEEFDYLKSIYLD